MFKKLYNKIFKSKIEYERYKSDILFKKRLKLFNNKYKKIIEEISSKIANKKELNFLHSGHCGDLIYSLAIVQKLSKSHKCNFYVGVDKKLNTDYYKHPAKTVFIDERMSKLILPLLKKQNYLNIADTYKGENIDVNLDLFRELPLNLLFNSPRWYFHITGDQVDLSIPYLEVDGHEKLKNKIIIHRTFRYRNKFINYNFMREYNDIFFIGLKEEYNDLKKQIPNLQIYESKDFLEMAKIIKSSKFFIGNLSVCYPIAEALKVPRLLEACPEFPVVQPVGGDGYDFYYQPHFEKWFKYLYDKY